jgi:hypothetical protein
LTDVRALDTLGEVVVLVVVAIGILALTRRRPDESEPEPDSKPGRALEPDQAEPGQAESDPVAVSM